MKTKLSLVVIAALSITSASAMQFQTLGYKSVSMGGAAVASSSGSIATYNNPALLAKAPYDVEVSLGGGISVSDHGAGASVTNLDDIGFIDVIDKVSNDTTALTPADQATLISGKNVVLGMDGDAIELAPQAYVAAQVSNFGMGVFVSSDVAGIANIDQNHDKLIFADTTAAGTYYQINDDGTQTASDLATYNASSIEYALNNGLTYIQAVGIGIGEVPVAYGHKFELSGGNLMVGGAPTPLT